MMSMRAIVLAAGRGSRLGPLTEGRPKCLVDVGGRPLLEHTLASLGRAGIDEIGIVTGYAHEQLSGYAVTRFHNPLWAATNMVASLACARKWLASGPCVVSYGDIVYAPQAARLLAECEDPLAITFDPNWLELWRARMSDPMSDAETFRCDGDGFVCDLGRRPRILDEVQGQYMGLVRFTPASWAAVEDHLSSLEPDRALRIDMTTLLRELFTSGRVRLRALAYDGPWAEIDAPSDRAVAERRLEMILHPERNG